MIKRAFLCALCLVLLAAAAAVPASAAEVRRSRQKLRVDGTEVPCTAYNIDDRNYFRLRDLAVLLDGTGSQFSVDYDEASNTVLLQTGEAYTKRAGSELGYFPDRSRSAVPSVQRLLLNGVECGDLSVWNIGDSNFFQLRELGRILGFRVDYDEASDTALVESIPRPPLTVLRETAERGEFNSENGARRVFEFAENAAWSIVAPPSGGALLTLRSRDENALGRVELELPAVSDAPWPVRFTLEAPEFSMSATAALEYSKTGVPDLSQPLSLRLENYDGPEEDRPAFEGACGSLLRLLLLRAEIDALRPNRSAWRGLIEL